MVVNMAKWLLKQLVSPEKCLIGSALAFYETFVAKWLFKQPVSPVKCLIVVH